MTLTFANALPAWALVVIIAAAALLGWHTYRGFAASPARRYALSALRVVTLLALLVILMRPVARQPASNRDDVVVPVLVDTSRSMGIEDIQGRRRIDAARDILVRQLLPALQERLAVDVLSFGEGLAPGAPERLTADARRTDLAAALVAAQERYRGRSVAGYILLSDGGHTGPALEELTRAGLPPIYPVAIGSHDAAGDREVLGLTAAEAVLDQARIDLAVSAISRGSGERLELRLLENGRRLDVRHVRPPAEGGPVQAVFQVAPPDGAPTIYTVEIPAAAGELVPENNRRSVLVQPPSRPRRVLLVEGAPGFEHSFLKRALLGDKGLRVDSVVRKGENEQGSDTFYIQAERGRGAALASGYPADPAALFAYDAVVLANVAGDQLTAGQLEATREFVARRGGGLLVMGAQTFLPRGLAGTPVEDALPVQLQGRTDAVRASAGRTTGTVSLTDTGLTHPVTQLAASPEDTRKRWASLPQLPGAAALGPLRGGGSVLALASSAAGTQHPLVAVQRYGEGRSMVFGGEGAWRWRMLLPSSDRSYEMFWRQSVRWLALGAADPVSVNPPVAGGAGESVSLKTTVRDPAFNAVPGAEVDVQVVGPDARVHHVRASRDERDAAVFTASFTPEQPGVYRMSVQAKQGRTAVGQATSAVLVGAADFEMADPGVNRALLERLAAASGGRVVEHTDVARLVETLRTSAPVTAVTIQRDLWHNAWSLAVIIALLAAEWLLRRRWGLR